MDVINHDLNRQIIMRDKHLLWALGLVLPVLLISGCRSTASFSPSPANIQVTLPRQLATSVSPDKPTLATLPPEQSASSYPTNQGGQSLIFPYPAPLETQAAGMIELSWDAYYPVSTPGWLNNTIAVLASGVDGVGKFSITVDISRGKFARASTVYTNEEWKIFSPKKSFVIDCGDGLKMFRVSDNKLISETALHPNYNPGVECTAFIEWAPDESVASFPDQDSSIYTWRSNGDPPKKITYSLNFTQTSWSPDSKMLAFSKSVQNLQNGLLDIIDADGNLLHEFQFKPGGDGPILGWLTNNILASYSRYTTPYYDIQSGQLLFSWTSMPTGNGIWHERPQVSPNNRWIFLDQGDQTYVSKSNPDRSIVLKDYSLYDFQEKRRIPLIKYLGNYLAYSGWSGDSSLMYVISRPAESVSTSWVSTPFGLLSYDPLTGKFVLLFKDAMQVAWNVDKSQAFLIYRKQDDSGNWFLAGGIWTLGTEAVVSPQKLYEQVVYQDPAMDDNFQAYSGPISVAWAHNGKMVAFRDISGKIKLINLSGSEKVLLDKELDRIVALRWSPDDQHLLILTGGHAWIVDIIAD